MRTVKSRPAVRYKLITMGGLIKRLEKPFINNPEKQRDPSNQIPTSTHKEGDTQTVGVIGIDPEKLMSKLELKFPSAFRVHVSRYLECGVVEIR